MRLMRPYRPTVRPRLYADLSPTIASPRSRISSRAALRTYIRASTIGIATLVCAVPAASASSPRQDQEIERRVGQLVDAGKYPEATQLLVDQLKTLPEGRANRSRRNLFAIQAANICKLAVRVDGCGAIRSGLRLADDYLREFERTFGASARTTDEFIGMAELREHFVGLRDLHACPPESLPELMDPPPSPVERAPEPTPRRPPAPKPEPRGLPRVFLQLGVGTGVGLARGVAELTYRQYTPASNDFTYGPAEFSCAIARWGAAGGALPDAVRLQGALNMLPADRYAPYDISTLVSNYDAPRCAEHHRINGGVASAPLHLAPELGVRVTRALVISGFARLQVLTGSRVFSQDTSLAAATSYEQDVISPNPTGVRIKPGFTAAGGLKLKYFLGRESRRFRGFVGGMIGLGVARLRAPLGFVNDRNGNSVPDDRESAVDADATHSCLPVWPYGGPACGAEASMTLAGQVARATDREPRVDTVRLGSGFVGALVGFNYQVAPRFALFAEVGVAVWFPRTTSMLVDLTLGPVLTF